MDEHFSELTRSLALPMPRRRALFLMAGTMAGALLGLAPRGAGAATCSQCTCNDDQHRLACANCHGCNVPDDDGKACF
jgi:hypothetical protein